MSAGFYRVVRTVGKTSESPTIETVIAGGNLSREAAEKLAHAWREREYEAWIEPDPHK